MASAKKRAAEASGEQVSLDAEAEAGSLAGEPVGPAIGIPPGEQIPGAVYPRDAKPIPPIAEGAGQLQYNGFYSVLGGTSDVDLSGTGVSLKAQAAPLPDGLVRCKVWQHGSLSRHGHTYVAGEEIVLPEHEVTALGAVVEEVSDQD